MDKFSKVEEEINKKAEKYATKHSKYRFTQEWGQNKRFYIEEYKKGNFYKIKN